MEIRDSGPDQARMVMLYVSEMAQPDAATVGQICRQSQANNERDGITGVLVFDGRAFCQFVEGPAVAMQDLRRRLERDPRHRRMHVLEFGPADTARRFPSWRLGYAFTADPAAIARIEGQSGAAALAAFAGWLPALSPAEASR